jgi:hypothetical protein
MPTKKQKFELLKAHHEAGHGVIARKLGIPVRRLTIFSADDDSEASALTESASYIARDADQATFVAAIENDVRVCLAGRVMLFRRPHFGASNQIVDDGLGVHFGLGDRRN